MKFLKKTVWVVLAAALVIFGVKAIKHKREQEARIPAAKAYAVTVGTTVAKERNATLTLPFVAQVRNDNDVAVATRLSARVLMMHKAGAHVKAGEAVARLDKRDLDAKIGSIRAQIAAAKAQLGAAKSALEALEAKHARTKKLLAVRGASQEEFDAETAQIAQTRAEVAAAKMKILTLEANLKEVAQQLDYAVLRAPVSGVVAETFVNPGDMAIPGKPLMRIRAKAGDYLVLKLPRDMKAESIRFEGESYELYPLEGTENGLSLYRTALLNRGLPTGAFVDVEVVTFRGEGLVLPSGALLSRGEDSAVFVIEGTRAEPLPVKIVAEGTEGVAVRAEGLAGRRVAVAKPDILLRLMTGVPVRTAGSGE